MVHDGVRYYTTYRGVSLESLGVYVVDHTGFKLPRVSSGAYIPEIGGGGLRTYAEFGEREITLTLKLENSDHTDRSIRALTGLFMTPGDLVLEERPDRYLSCRLSGGISTVDSPGFTNLTIPLLAEFPYFLDLDLQVVPIVDDLVIAGNAPCYPKIYLRGITEDPTLSVLNAYGSSSKKMLGVSIGATDRVTIDCLSNRVLFNDHAISGLCTGGKIVLAPGNNTLKSNVPDLVVEYRNTYL